MLREEPYCHSDNKLFREQMTIELLCDNILLEIFSYLNAKDLKNVSLVNKHWNEIVGASSVTVMKFQFQIKTEMLEIKNFGSNRNHQNYAISTEESIDWAGLAGNIRLQRVKSFHIRRSRFCETIDDKVMAFLLRLTELENLFLEDVKLTGTEEFVPLLTMPNLNSVIITGNDFKILDYIDVKQLEKLQCISRCKRNLEDFETIAHSIIRFSHLKCLVLWNCMEMFECIDMHQVNCKLHSLEVYHINVEPIDVTIFDENLKHFLMLQADSLREMKFDFSMFDVEYGQQIVKDLLQIAFNKCSKLASLDIRNLSIPRDRRFYQEISPNHSIKELKVHWGFEGDVIDGLLRSCPKLEKLEADLCHLNSDGINGIATLCKELIHLYTYTLVGIADASAVLQNLKYLSIFKIENSFEPLLSLVVKSPVIHQIRIYECSNAESFPMDTIIRQLSMRKLIINDKCYDIYSDEANRRIVKQSQFTYY